MARQTYKLVALDAPKLHPKNRRRGDVGAIVESIRANGFYGSCMIQKSTGHLIFGNHRYQGMVQAAELIRQATAGEWTAHDDDEAALIESWRTWPDRYGRADRIPVIEIDVDDDRAERMLIVDNRSSDLSDWDERALADDLVAMFEATGSIEGTGWSGDDLDTLLADLELAAQGPERSDASLLARVDVSVADPVHVAERGAIYRLGKHLLCVVDLMADWPVWGPLLEEGALFVPYPTPYLPLTDRAERQPLVMVQPEPFIAGHILDKWVAAHDHRADSYERIEA